MKPSVTLQADALLKASGGHKPPEAVRDIVEKLVAAINAQADGALRRAREDAESEIARVATVAADLQRQVQSQHDLSHALRAELASEQKARLAAEAAAADAVRDRDRTATACEAHVQSLQRDLDDARRELERLQHQFEAAKAGAAKIAAALQTFQIVVTAGPEDGGPGPGKGLPRRTPREEGGAAPGELVGYAANLLDDIEAMFQADRESARSAGEVTERLTANLRYGRELFLRRSTTREADLLFKQHIMALVASRGDTDFGRHLAYAAYDLYPRSEPSSSAA